jgi:pseudouridine-5'-phosphate glycosidase
MKTLSIAPHIFSAVESGRPVVALETTLVTHGFQHPEGLAVAQDLEHTVRDEGAEPATIGVVDGRLKVGLSGTELETLSRTRSVSKLNLSNLAAEITTEGIGSTTVAATMLAAHLAGIRVFSTGGIGGVHRGAAESGDVSADLKALSMFPVAVVCAGAKAVLDLPKTVEALETNGVPIFGVGTDRFPAFYRRDSGLPVDRGFDDITQLAMAVGAHFELEIGSGVVVANPVPLEAEMPEQIYEAGLTGSLEDLATSGIRGRDVTPYLLERLRTLTEGQSVFSNRALLLHNATIAARLAVALG